MKKLLIASVFCLLTAMVTGQTIITYTPYCCTAGIAVTANYYSRPAPVSHYWSIASCDASGNNVGIPQYSGSLPSGNGNYTFQSSVASALCGSFALVKLYVEKAGTPNYWLTFTSVVFVNPLPVISGPTTICGTGTYCVSNYDSPPGYTYNWEALSGVVTQWSGTGYCVTIPPMFFNNVMVTITDPNGCQSSSTLAVTNNYIDPSFYVSSVGAVDPTHFKIAFQRPTAAGSTIDEFMVEEVSSSSPYTPVASSQWPNPNWAATPNWYSLIYAVNYDGDCYPPYNCLTSYPFGHFKNSATYAITRTINNSGCISKSRIVFNKYGAVCYNCRTAEDENTIAELNTVSTFEVFPNPNNGTFQVQLGTAAENAQVELINMLGERADAFTFSGTSYSYSPSQTLATGVYLLRITSNGVVNSKRIIVQ